MTAAALSVVIYCRISLDRSGEMLGVERQETECRAFAASKGWTVADVVVDNDISATSGKLRPGFESLLADPPAAVLVWHADRLVRMSRELERVIDAGLHVHAVHAGFLDLSTPAGRAVAKTLTAWAQYEGEQKSLRQKASHAQRAKAGRPWWTARPFGYNPDGTVDVNEAAAVRDAYGAIIGRRATLTEIARAWTAAGLRTTRKVRDEDGNVIRDGGDWSSVSVGQLLRNPRNAAIRTQHGTEVGPGKWTPIVDGDTYRAALAVLSDPARRVGGGGRRTGLLVGVATCGPCGSPVRLSTNGSKVDGTRKVWRKVYACPKGCTTHPVTDLDAYVGEITVALLRDPRFASALTGAADNGDLLADRETLVVTMREVGEDYADGLIDRTEFRSLRRRQLDKLADLDAAIRASLNQTTLAGLPDLAVMAEGWHGDALTDAEKRRVIAAFLTIKLDPRQRGERVYRPEVSARVDPVLAGDGEETA